MANGTFKLPISTGGTGFTGEWTQEWYESIYNNSYTRPTDWLDIITPHPLIQGDQKFVGLHAVFNNTSNFCAVLATTSTGSYRVNWGDGTFTDHASNTTAYKVFNYADFSGTESTKGYRQAIVTIVPLTGNLLSVNLYQKHNQTGLANGYTTGWLDVRIAGEFMTSMVIGNSGTNVRQNMLEQFDFVGTNAISIFQNMFQNCVTLQKIIALHVQSTGTINMAGMFQNCLSLQTIPLLNTSNVTTMGSMFQGCLSLQTIPLLNTSNVTTATLMFASCGALHTIPLLNTSFLATATSMFASCGAFQTMPLLNTSNVTNMASMFQGCSSLVSIPLLNTSSLTTMTSMFNSCFSLQKIPNLQFSATTGATDFSNIVNACSSLSELPIDGIKNTISVANCKLSAMALNDLFTRLAVVSGKTITITGNWGASDGATDRSIATAKGWTVVG